VPAQLVAADDEGFPAIASAIGEDVLSSSLSVSLPARVSLQHRDHPRPVGFKIRIHNVSPRLESKSLQTPFLGIRRPFRFDGALNRTRTCTVAHVVLSHARIPFRHQGALMIEQAFLAFSVPDSSKTFGLKFVRSFSSLRIGPQVFWWNPVEPRP
jgi:hypothetical protein